MIPGFEADQNHRDTADQEEAITGADQSPELAILAGRNAQLRRRQRIAVVVAAICVVLAAGGFIAARFVKSPQQQAAEVGPPKASALTAVIQDRILTQTLITRGTVAAAHQIQVTPAAPSQGATTAVVTRVRVKPGQTIKPGQVLLEVSGRPVIALPGTQPAYRDLTPGDSGRDITELQRALHTLSFYPGKPSGVFGWETKKAVAGLYKHLGYDTPTTGGTNDVGDKQALQGAQNAVDEAQRAVDDMKRQIAAAEAQATSATKANKDGSSSEAPSGGEPLSLQLQYLQRALDQAIDNQNQLIATTGPEMPLAELVFVPSFPARVETLNASVGQSVSGSLLTLSAGQLAVRAELDPDQRNLVKEGSTVTITSETLGQQVPGRLTAIGKVTTQASTAAAPSAQTDANSQGSTTVAPYVPIAITSNKPLPAAWNGQDVRLTFTQARTANAVLVVPISAITTGADGSTTITVVTGGNSRRVPVRAGATADGYVQVTPINGHKLRPGDRVAIGQR